VREDFYFRPVAVAGLRARDDTRASAASQMPDFNYHGSADQLNRLYVANTLFVFDLTTTAESSFMYKRQAYGVDRQQDI